MANIKRKKLWIGRQIQVCGKSVNKPQNLICLLSATLPHTIHTSLAVHPDTNHIIIAQFDSNTTNNPNGETTWVEALG